MAVPVHAGSLCPDVREDGTWAAACFEGQGDARRLKQAYRKNIRIDKRGVAVLLIGEPRELVAVDRRGRVIVPGIYHWGDFDYPDTPQGIGRYAVAAGQGAGSQKCGYFDARRFRILVPARFDHCRAFIDDDALACTDCAAYCTDQDCHDRVFIAGRAEVLGRDGKTLRSYLLPTLEQACRVGQPQVTPLSERVSMLRCPDAQPFIVPKTN